MSMIYSAKNATVQFLNTDETPRGNPVMVEKWRVVPPEMSETWHLDPLFNAPITITTTIDDPWINWRYLKWRFLRPDPPHNRRWRRRRAYKLAKLAQGR
jgi:hypothetical protein